MTTWNYMREGQMANVDTDYKLTGDGAGGTLNDIQTMSVQNRVSAIDVSWGFGATTAAVGTVIVILKGTAVKAGAQYFPVAANSGVGTSVTMAPIQLPTLNVDVALQPGTLEIHAITSGGDSGTPEIMVTCTLDDKQSSGAFYLLREGQTGTADSWSTLVGTGLADTNTDLTMPGSKIVQIIYAVGPGATAGACTHGCRLVSVQGSLPGGDQTFAGLSTAVGAGAVTDQTIIAPLIKNVDIAVVKGAQVKIQAVMSGADSGTPEQAVGLVVLP